MTNNAPADDRAEVSVKLHPQLESFLRSLIAKSGRSLQGEIVQLIREAMQTAEIPPAPTNTPFVCSEELMVEEAECTTCGERIDHNAKLWAERHVQATGHTVNVSLFYDLRDDDWQSKLSPERRAEIEDFRKPGAAQALAHSLLGGKKH